MNEDIERDYELEKLLSSVYEKLDETVALRNRMNIIFSSGRNSPCPCGSGKKSKKCCASSDNEKLLSRANRGIQLIIHVLNNRGLMV